MFTIFFRTIILYLFIVLGIRLLGKRQVGELEPSELVLSFLIADLASVPMQDLGFPLHTGLIPILTLLAVSSMLSLLTLNSVKFRNLLCGKPSIIIRKGVIDQTEMRRNRLTIDELLEELRGKGHIDLSTIEYAVLESNGLVSVLPYPKNQPLTLGQMEKFSSTQIHLDKLGLPHVLVSDGVLLKDNLQSCGLDMSWLQQKMIEKKCSAIADIFLLQVNGDGSIYLVKKKEVLPS